MAALGHGHDDDHRLLVISPVRNEAEHIERCVKAVATQTRCPDLWIVVDDGSNDETPAMLASLAAQVPFMRVISRGRELDDSTPDRLASAAAPKAFNVGLRSVNWTDYSHIGKLDADIELPENYFEVLLSRFRDDRALGMSSGDLVERSARGWKRIAIPRHHIPGATKLYSRKCLERIGGVKESLGWDTIDETYARMLGFRTHAFGDLIARHHRPCGSAAGLLRGRARHGECAWVAHFGPGWVAMRAIKVAALQKPRGISGAAFFFGYARAATRRVPRVEDPAFRRFVRGELRARMLRPLRPRAA